MRCLAVLAAAAVCGAAQGDALRGRGEQGDAARALGALPNGVGTLTATALPGGLVELVLERTDAAAAGDWYLALCLGGPAQAMVGSRCVVGGWEAGKPTAVGEYLVNSKSATALAPATAPSALRAASMTVSGATRRLQLVTASIAGTAVNLAELQLNVATGPPGGKHTDYSQVDAVALATPAKTFSSVVAGVAIALTPLADGRTHVDASFAATAGWLAVGLGSSMVGSGVVIGGGKTLNTASKEWEISSKTGAGITPYAGASDLADVSYVVAGGRLKLSFVASKIAGRALGANPSLVAAHGVYAGAANTMQQHTASGTGGAGAAIVATQAPVTAVVGGVTVSLLPLGAGRTMVTATAPGPGWLAVGLGTSMPGSKVVFGGKVQSAPTAVDEWAIAGQSLAAITAFTGASDVTQKSYGVVDGKRTLSFVATNIAGAPIGQLSASLVAAQGAYDATGQAAIHATRGAGVVALVTTEAPTTVAPSTPALAPSTPAVAPSTPAPAPTAPQPVTVPFLGGAGALTFTVRDGQVSIDATFPTSGWVAIGLGKTMSGSVVILADAATSVIEKQITSRSGAGIQNADAQSASTVKVQRADGKTTLTFRASALGGRPFTLDGSDDLVVAYGTTLQLAQHSAEARATFNVNWAAGSAAVVQEDHTALFAHAAIMVSCMLYLMPLAIIPSVFREQLGIGEGKPAFWYIVHRGLQLGNCLLVFVGFCIVAASLPADEQFDNAHKKAGLAVLLLCAAQPVLALYFRKGDKIPRSVWLASHLLFAAIITLGSIAVCLSGVELASEIVGAQAVQGLRTATKVGAVIVIIVAVCVAAKRLIFTPQASYAVKDEPLDKKRGAVIRWEEKGISESARKGSLATSRGVGSLNAVKDKAGKAEMDDEPEEPEDAKVASPKPASLKAKTEGKAKTESKTKTEGRAKPKPSLLKSSIEEQL
jgi:hypothetical protein